MTELLTVLKSATLGTLVIKEPALLLLLEKAAFVLSTVTGVAGTSFVPCPLLHNPLLARLGLLSATLGPSSVLSSHSSNRPTMRLLHLGIVSSATFQGLQENQGLVQVEVVPLLKNFLT